MEEIVTFVGTIIQKMIKVNKHQRLVDIYLKRGREKYIFNLVVETMRSIGGNLS